MSYSNKIIKLKGDINQYKVLTDLPDVRKVLFLKDGDVHSVSYSDIEIVDIITKTMEILKFIFSLFKKRK